jgi:hypothetical protein
MYCSQFAENANCATPLLHEGLQLSASGSPADASVDVTDAR